MRTTTDFTGQRVLVIDGSHGVGLSIAQGAADSGATVIIGACDSGGARIAAAKIPGADSVRIDITDELSIIDALKASGRVDHIVVTASAHYSTRAIGLEQDRAVDGPATKAIGPMLIAKHAKGVLPPTGSLVLFSGVAAWNPGLGLAIMGNTNGAVAYVAMHLARELAPIRVNAVSPGVVDPGGADTMGEGAERELSAAGDIDLSRTGSNDDITAAVLWLFGAAFVSGETIQVENGANFA